MRHDERVWDGMEWDENETRQNETSFLSHSCFISVVLFSIKIERFLSHLERDVRILAFNGDFVIPNFNPSLRVKVWEGK